MHDIYAKQIAYHLSLQNILRVCISPGSRSTPLTYALSQQKNLEKMIHFDERGAAFHAYGYAKSSKTPVAIVVTSGSAVGNLFPAIIDAFLEEVPLIIITADRPPELLECGANQTCDQVKIFHNYVRWYFSIPGPDSAIPEGFIGSTVAQAIRKATHPTGGPVHLNCCFREPFFTEHFPINTPCISYEPTETHLSTEVIQIWANKLSSAKRGVIIVGSTPAKSSLQPICDLAIQLDWPIFTDVLSGLRSKGTSNNVIPYHDFLLASMPTPDCILHFGDRLVSKTLIEWIKNSSPSFYSMVNASQCRHDPLHKLTHKITIDPANFCTPLLPLISQKKSWSSEWKLLSQKIENTIDNHIPSHSEPGLFRFLHHYIPKDFSIFFANSLPIRDANNFFFPKSFNGTVFGKRGSSGIDGNIATAIGLAEGSKTPLIAILGDIAALHDINSLAQLQKCKTPVIIIIINNQGGGIFSFLPIAQKKDVFEEYFATHHPFNFEHAAKMFSLPYFLLKDLNDLSRFFKQPTSYIIEFQTDREKNCALHKEIEKKINKEIS
jgi:2-succinyl-5-enolpyruvyl-6-hydroxy-3-cyclohexene-1-carboxylate synthase